MSDDLDVGSFIFGVIITSCILLLTIYFIVKNHRESAVRHGAAEFIIIDKATGKTEFRWKDEINE